MHTRFLYRVRRQRTALGAAVLLGLVVVVSSTITADSREKIGTTIENNGRGAYDLLVTAGSRVADSAAEHHGLIEQNFAAFAGTGGISINQLAEIRRMPGVDVAAPLTFVGDLTSPAYGVLVGARDPAGATEGFFTSAPQAFKVAITISTSDGVRTQTLSSTSCDIVVARVGSGTSAKAIMAASGVVSANTEDLSADVTIPGVPALSSGMVAIDPVAEEKLLGPPGGFLSPLVKFDHERSAGVDVGTLADLVPDRYNIERSALQTASSRDAVAPVIVSDSAYAPLSARVTVTALSGTAPSSAKVFQSTAIGVTALTAAGQDWIDHATRGRTQTTVYDLTHDVVPFAEPYFSIPLPGAKNGPDGAADTSNASLVPKLVRPAPYTPASARRGTAPSGVAAHLSAEDQGYVEISPTAKEQTYRPLGGIASGKTKSFLFAPLGTYSPGDVTGTAVDVSYVPLGTYSAGTATVTQAGPNKGDKLGPAFSGRGLELSAPGAITTLSALQAFRPTAGVDVVRVRIGGGRTYTPAIKKKIDDVAAHIADLGLSVRVVAGSSLAPVGIYVPRFFAPQGAAKEGKDLGWIRQEWTSLGAAVTVEHASLVGTAWLLAISLLAAVLLTAAVQALALRSRHREAALLIQLGWPRRRVFAWFLAEGSIGVSLVAVGAVVALTFNLGNPLALGTSVSAVTLSLVLTVATAWLASRTVRSSTTSSRVPKRIRTSRSPRAVGSRIAAAEPGASVIMALALAAIAGTAVAFAAVVDRAKRASGDSRLAEVVGQQLALPQAVLAVLSCVASGILFSIGAIVLRRHAAPVALMLMTTGWSGRDLAILTRASVSRPAVPGVLLGAGVGTALALALDSQHWWYLSVLGLAVALLVFAAAAFSATRYGHHLAGMVARNGPTKARRTSTSRTAT